MQSEDINYDVINGEIVDGSVQVTEVQVWTVKDHPVTVSFEEAVPEDEMKDRIASRFIERINDLQTEPDFDYTEPRHFRGESMTSKALVEMFHICPFTTGQYSEYSNLDYASSYPSKLRDKGLVTSIGNVENKSIWVLTPLGTKEALCLMGWPDAQEELVEIREPQEKSGLDSIFDGIDSDSEEESEDEDEEEADDE